MDQAIGLETNEMKKVIATVAVEFYAQGSPAAVAGRHAGAAFAELRRHAQRLFNPEQLIEGCNSHILWALTPVVAASLACGAGEDRVSLREIGAALSQMLAAALASTERRIAA